jgi:hypothetical protein
MYILAESSVLQLNITSRMPSLISLIGKRKKENVELLWVEDPLLKFYPSPPSFTSVLGINTLQSIAGG